MWPTLREFLAEGFYPIPPVPPPRPGSRTTRATGIRQPSTQSLELIEATPGQHITVKTDADIFLPMLQALESRLNLDAPVPGEIPLQFARAAAESRNAATIEGGNLKDGLKRAYDIVNNLVRLSLGKEAVALGKWTVIDDQSEQQAHLAYDQGKPGQTYISGTPDGACAPDARLETPAIALLESTVTSLFNDDRDLRRQKATLRSETGMVIYLSQASRKLRTWNSYLRNGTAQFWINFVAQIWEEMHQYRAECVVITSGKFTSLFKRTAANHITVSPINTREDGDVTAGHLNMLEILTAFAVSKPDDPLTKWNDYPGAPAMLQFDSEDDFLDDDATPTECPPPATVTITAAEPAIDDFSDRQELSELRYRSVAHLALSSASDTEAREQFSRGHKTGTYTLHLGERIGCGRTYDCYRVKDTNMVSASGRLVAKVVPMATFPARDGKWRRSRSATREAVRAEAALYSGPLKSLQGDAVPIFHGLWTGTVSVCGKVESKDYAKPNGHANGHANGQSNGHANGHANGHKAEETSNEIMIMILEDVGRAIADRSEYVSDYDIVDIVDLYDRLHSVNVVHGDIGVKHVMKLGLGELRLIDFENAWRVDPDKPKEYVDLLDEKRTVLREFKQTVPPELENLVPPWEMD